MSNSAMERIYIARIMADPEEREKARLRACERHAKYLMYAIRSGKYDHLTYDERMAILKDHSDQIDWFWIEGAPDE